MLIVGELLIAGCDLPHRSMFSPSPRNAGKRNQRGRIESCKGFHLAPPDFLRNTHNGDHYQQVTWSSCW